MGLEAISLASVVIEKLNPLCGSLNKVRTKALKTEIEFLAGSVGLISSKNLFFSQTRYYLNYGFMVT